MREERYKGKRWIWRDWEICGIRVHDVKFLMNQYKNYVSLKKINKYETCIQTALVTVFNSEAGSKKGIGRCMEYYFKMLH